MITKIVRKHSRYHKYLFGVYDEDELNFFAFIALNMSGQVYFLITEDKYLDVAEMGIIFEFMDRLQKIGKGTNLDTITDEYFFNEPGPAQSTNSLSKQQSER